MAPGYEYSNVDADLERLTFISIQFAAKNGNLAEALQEALVLSGKAGVGVTVLHDGHSIKIETKPVE